MKVTTAPGLANQLGLKNKADDANIQEPFDGRTASSNTEESVEKIDANVDRFNSNNETSSKIYNRFRTTNQPKKNSEFVKTTLLKPGTFSSIELNIHYDGLNKSDFRDVDVWKDTIGKTVYGISKTLDYVHKNSRTAFPEKIEFEEDYTTEGFKDVNSFYSNLNEMAQKLSKNSIDGEKLQETISSYIENYS